MKRRRETTADFFRQIMKAIKENASTKEIAEHLDYALADSNSQIITNDEFDLIPILSKGGNEGWYVDVYLQGSWSQEQNEKSHRLHIGTCKTLHENLDGALIMGCLTGAITYFGQRILMLNEELYATDECQNGKGEDDEKQRNHC